MRSTTSPVAGLIHGATWQRRGMVCLARLSRAFEVEVDSNGGPKKKGNAIVMGPYPADGFFGSRQFTKPDGILAMYHDQGLIPFKALSFGTGVNFTAGLPIVRTSPDHGTAFDLAGNNAADPGSMVSALRLAIDLVHNRQSHKEANANPLGKLSNNPAESMP